MNTFNSKVKFIQSKNLISEGIYHKKSKGGRFFFNIELQ